MKVRLARSSRKPQRGGFTLIELLVVISIIAVLASLILPAVQNAREAGRRITCLNNMKNVGLAALNYATANNGALPPLVGGIDYYGEAGATNGTPAPWTVHLLPYMEQTGLYERLIDSGTTAVELAQLRDVNIPVLTCPNDLTSNDAGALSFAANAGYIANSLWTSTDTGHRIQQQDGSGLVTYYIWDSLANTDNEGCAKKEMATGVFWRQDSAGTRANTVSFNPTSYKMTLDRMRDGTTQTLLLTENVTNGGWLPSAQTAATGAATADVGFGFCVPDDSTSGTIDVNLSAVGTDGATATTLKSRINSNLDSTTSIARPASLHPQIVNMMFCDGSGRSINQSIADSVYARLISPNGNDNGQQILSGNDY